MGEYAKYRGQSVKIGTCGDMYYLRFDQRSQVQHEPGNVHPVNNAGELRFRFPWPDEDTIPPGSDKFHDNGYHRVVWVPGLKSEPTTEHGTVQFTAPAGYLVSLPCPEGPGYVPDTHGAIRHETTGVRLHRNGFRGAVGLVAQRYIDGRLVPVLKCGGCGHMWREESPAAIEHMAVLLRAKGDRSGNRAFFHGIADRLLSGANIIAEVVP